MNLPSAEFLDNIPSLSPWLLGEAWRQSFEIPTTGLPRITTVRVLEDDEAAPHGCDILLEADIGKDLKTRVLLTFAYDRRTRGQTLRMTRRCECDADSDCHHALAVLETLARIAGGETEAKPTPAAP